MPVLHKFPIYEACYAFLVGYDNPYEVHEVHIAVEAYKAGRVSNIRTYQRINIPPASSRFEPPTEEAFLTVPGIPSFHHISRIDPQLLSATPAGRRLMSPSPGPSSYISPTRPPSYTRAHGGIFSTPRFRNRGSSVSTYGGTPPEFYAYLSNHTPTPTQSPTFANRIQSPTTPTPTSARITETPTTPAPVRTTDPALTADPAHPVQLAVLAEVAAAATPVSSTDITTDMPPSLKLYLFYHGFDEEEVADMTRIVGAVPPESNPITIVKLFGDVMRSRLPDCPYAPQWFFAELRRLTQA